MLHIRLELSNYESRLGEEVFVCGQHPALLNDLKMTYSPAGWYVAFDSTPEDLVSFSVYSYKTTWNQDVYKRQFPALTVSAQIVDDWTLPRSDPWFTSAMNVMLTASRTTVKAPVLAKSQTVFQVLVPYVQPHEEVFIVGASKELGLWKIDDAVKMEHVGNRVFTTSPIVLTQLTEFKFVVKHCEDNFTWESGKNRAAQPVTQQINGFFRYPYKPEPKFAGVNVPVFSLNTKNSFGCGEFSDIKVLADFCKKAGLRVIQVLPIFDTINTQTWVDSYPYGAITVFALHPMYINIGQIKGVTKKVLEEVETLKPTMIPNAIEIQYEKVVAEKLRLMKKIYKHLVKQDRESLTKQIMTWAESSPEIKYWIQGYTVFKYLAETFKTVDFNKWTEQSFYDNAKFLALKDEQKQVFINKLFSNADGALLQDQQMDMLFYTWMQMQLDEQLFDAANYCRQHGIILKGDIPIGVNKVSLDTWERTSLFNMETSTGAPPDAFSATGQNWGFPTYNWELMANDDYKWWQQRFKHMGRFFDAFRIDHVLGWFRIWEIPGDCIKGNGRLGRFYPAMPIRWEWLEQKGIWDRQRLTQPWNPIDVIGKLISQEDCDYLEEEKLINIVDGFIKLTKTEVQIDLYLQDKVKEGKLTREQYLTAIQGVVLLNANRCLSEDRRYKQFDCHPIFCNTVEGTETYSFSHLAAHEKDILRKFALEYFYKWHEEIWGDAASKRLPAIGRASDMLIVGEDLGLLAPVVPKKMGEYGLLGLRVQRMPADPTQDFWNCDQYDWMTVCTPATHDCSGLRSWWNDKKTAEKYWYQQLGRYGQDYMKDISAQDCKNILRKHLYSKSMVAVFLMQDLMSMDKNVHYQGDVTDEDINHPDVAEWNWKYHMHITLEEMMENGFAEECMKEVLDSGRII
ncbi:4-alpha-glucanotransferase [Hexamita inflata]|uniref:4-alpha-glucanotransferase n=1 Tax=Hexamita inflata TaxID=28002 RepID=A0ABP1HZA9_9EUKA